MRPASEAEKARLADLFTDLCRIPSPFGREKECAERVRAELRGIGVEVADMGGTMRLGADPVKLHPDTKARELYGEAVIYERHRHRYEVNNFLRKRLEAAGLVISGTSPDERLVEVIELPDHPVFVASQYHPEFKSRPLRPQPLFRDFVGAALDRASERAPEVEPAVRAESHA